VNGDGGYLVARSEQQHNGLATHHLQDNGNGG